ncbi:hypothetical protein HYR69_12030, partial [Candidatus Sumerlaeota bacterium]|nr:hypothetical protein [Candidatus Sumerlaeota bacterium]
VPQETAPSPARAGMLRQLWENFFQQSANSAPAAASSDPNSPAPAQGTGLTGYLPVPLQTLVNKYNIRPSVIGDFVYAGLDARERESEDVEHLLMRELEFAVSADLASTVRADVLYSIGREEGHFGSGFEEAYLTFLSLPLDFQARVGKFKAAFGKVNQTHQHALPWIDVPAMQSNFFGESLTGTGVSLSHMVPNPWDVYSELIFQVIDINAGSEIAGQNGRGLTEVAHWKNVFDLTPDSTLEAGLSAADITQRRGGHSTAEGIDLTYKWRPAEQGLYHSITWMNELDAIQNDAPAGEQDHYWGAYSSFEYQFARRWYSGLRLDYTEVPLQTSNEYAFAPFITFRQTERLYYRLQFNHIENDPDHEGRSSNDIRLQISVSLGSHAPHIY